MATDQGSQRNQPLTESPLPRDPLHDRPNRGFHPVLEQEQPYLFVDGCMQIWPDADLPNAHRHGCNVFAVTALTPHTGLAPSLDELLGWHALVRANPNLSLALSTHDIRQARANGQASLLLAAQDGEFLGDNPARLEAFARLGLRMLIPAYNRNNLFCGGVLEYSDAGLSGLGRDLVTECNRWGVVIDLSHVSRRSSFDIMEQSTQPCVFSHSNPSALVDNPRNIDDEQLKAVAEQDGLVGLVNWGPLLFREGMQRRPNLSDFLDHIDYVADLLGSTANLGIGTDFSLGSYPRHNYDSQPHYRRVASRMNEYVTDYWRAPERFAEGFDNYPAITAVIQGLSERGYSNDDIAGILGENFMRIFETVWPAGQASTTA